MLDPGRGGQNAPPVVNRIAAALAVLLFKAALDRMGESARHEEAEPAPAPTSR